METKLKRTNGITLIALIITIIVLLILAGVALATLTGEGSIIENAENAVGKYNNSVIAEQQLLNEIEKYFIEHTNGDKEDKGVIVDKTEIANNPEDHFGGYVDYTPANGDPEVKWRIFYADESNVYLIADDYINPEYSPANWSGGTVYKYDTPLSICNYEEDAKQITDPRIIKLASFLNYELDYTSRNIKGSIAMLDTTKWEMYVNNDYAEYAIGGPTLDLYCMSYNKMYTGKQINYRVYEDKDKSILNYELKWSEDESYNYEISGLETSESLYTKRDDKSAAMWIASPYDIAVGDTFRVIDDRIHPVDGSSAGTGLRPVVCLKSDVQITKKSDGTYTLSLPE